MRKRALFVAAAIAWLAATPVMAAQVTVFVGGAMTGPLREVGAAYSQRTGTAVEIVSDTTGGLQRRLRAGEKADIVVIATQAMDVMQTEKLVTATGRADLALALIGLGVHAGAKAPDISSADAFKRTVLAARSISFVDPASGGISGTHIAGVLQRMGIANAVKAKTVYRNQGAEVAAAVAAGEAEIGITFSSELLPNKGVSVVGPLPNDINLPTVYTVAVTSAPPNLEGARALLQALQSPQGRAAIQTAGLDPLPANRP